MFIDKYLLLLIILSSLYLFIPVYDGFEFKNVFEIEPIFDARSPVNYVSVQKLLSNQSITFDKNFDSDFFSVKDNVDFTEYSNGFVSSSRTGFLVFFSLLFAPFFFLGYNTFGIVIILQILISILAIMVFYHILRLKTSKFFSFFFSIVFGFGTGIFIYSRLFFRHNLDLLFFLFMFYFFLKHEKENKKKFFYLFLFVSFFFTITAHHNYLYTFSIIGKIFTPNLCYVLIFLFFSKKHLKKYSKELFVFFLAVFLMISFLELFSINKGDFIGPQNFMLDIYEDHNVNSYYYELFGSENSESSLFYSYKGEGFFFNVSGFFDALFSERGIIFNSLFLLFGLFFLFSTKTKNSALFFTLIAWDLVPSFFLIGYGGFIPRYNRLFFITMTLLAIVSFENFHKLKPLMKLLFVSLSVLSIINVVSLGIRLDWSYESPQDLISNDIVLFYGPSEDYGSFSEFLSVTNCSVAFSGGGILLDNCFCSYPATFSTRLAVNNSVDFFACSRYAGGDGVNFLVNVLNRSYDFHLPSNSCDVLRIDNISGENEFLLSTSVEGECYNERVEVRGYDIR